MAFFVSLDDDPADVADEPAAVAAKPPPSDGNPLFVEVSNLAGPLCNVPARDSWTIYNLKQGIAEAIGIHPTNQKLLHNGEVLTSAFAKLQDVFPSDQADILLVRVQDFFVRFEAPFVCVAPTFLVEDMTVSDAKDRCVSLDCQGFVYYGGVTEESHIQAEIHFKKNISFDTAALAETRRRPKLFVNLAEIDCRSMLMAYVSEQSGRNRDAIRFIQQRDLIEELVKENFFVFEHVCQGLRDDPEIIQAAVMQNPMILRYASTRQLDNKELIASAVRVNGSALEYASKSLQADREIVTAAISENPGAFRFACQSLWKDKEIVLHLVACRGKELQGVAPTFGSDREVVLAAIRQNGDAIKFASPELQLDEEMIAEARSQLLRCKFK